MVRFQFNPGSKAYVRVVEPHDFSLLNQCHASSVFVAASSVGPEAGFGLFANKDFEIGETIIDMGIPKWMSTFEVFQKLRSDDNCHLHHFVSDVVLPNISENPTWWTSEWAKGHTEKFAYLPALSKPCLFVNEGTEEQKNADFGFYKEKGKKKIHVFAQKHISKYDEILISGYIEDNKK